MKAVLLAAGKNSRMWPLAQHKNKCMYEFLGNPLIYYTLIGLKKIGLKDIIIVVPPEDDSIKNYFGKGGKFGLNIIYGVQVSPKGTGDAVLSVKDFIDGDFVLANATKANISMILKPMLETYEKTKDVVLCARNTNTPWKYGNLKTKADKVIAIIEKPKEGEEKSSKKVEGVYILTKSFLDILGKIPIRENSLEIAIQKYIDQEKNVRFTVVDKVGEYSLKYPWDVLDINKTMLDSIEKSTISKKARIHETAIIQGKVIIKDNVIINEHAVIKGPCYIGENSIIGNNALVREYTSIGRNSVVGFSTDVKDSVWFEDVRADMCYVGDSILDEGARLGAGTITANRRLDRSTVKTPVKGEMIDSGRTFFGCVLGMSVKTGIHTSIMPGVKVGKNSLIWPQTNLIKDVPDESIISSQSGKN